MEIKNPTPYPAQESTTAASGYVSLEQIRDGKDALRDNIRRDEEHIQQLWSQLFARPEPLSALTPSKRISTLMNTGAGVLDGLILGWKLYRKFKRKK